MELTNLELLIMVFAVALGAIINRFTLFLFFSKKKDLPNFIVHLGNVLSPAMLGLLVVFCFRNVSFTSDSLPIAEIIATIFIVLLHKLKNNVFLSIGGGTLVYMIIVQNFI